MPYPGNEPGVAATLNTMTDDQLFEVMTNLGGHDISTLLEAFELAKASDTPTAFICYTIKVSLTPVIVIIQGLFV